MVSAVRKIPLLVTRYEDFLYLRRRIAKYRVQVAEQEQPFGRVYSMIRDARIRRGVESRSHEMYCDDLQYKQHIMATSLSIRCDLVILTDFLAVRQEECDLATGLDNWRLAKLEIDFSEAYAMCEGLLASATASGVDMQSAEAAVYFARFVALERSAAAHARPGSTSAASESLAANLDTARQHLADAAQLCNTKPGSTRGMQEEVEAAQKMLRNATFYEPVSNKEKQEVVAAMSREWAGATGHWYRCPNGHPFAIGNCGQAMEVATCPECGAVVGGAHHTLTAGNTRAADLEQGLGQLRI